MKSSLSDISRFEALADVRATAPDAADKLITIWNRDGFQAFDRSMPAWWKRKRHGQRNRCGPGAAEWLDVFVLKAPAPPVARDDIVTLPANSETLILIDSPELSKAQTQGKPAIRPPKGVLGKPSKAQAQGKPAIQPPKGKVRRSRSAVNPLEGEAADSIVIAAAV